MIELKLNLEIIDRLKKEGFYTESLLTQYFILLCLYNNTRFWLNIMSDDLSSKRFILHYYELLKRGLVEETAKGNEYFSLTEKGNLLMEELNNILHPKVDKVDSWIDDWLDLYPKGVKSGGKLLRSDRAGCLKKMEKFVKDTKYSFDTIKEATINYLTEFEQNDYKYCKCATYFIEKKGEGSELAARCEDLKDDVIKNDIFTIANTGGLI